LPGHYHPVFLDNGDKRKMIAEFIQLTAREEKKFWPICNTLQSKNAVLTSENLMTGGSSSRGQDEK
jgi:hypothetical protein